MVYLFPRMQWVLTPCIRRTLALKKQVERRQNWLSTNLLSSPYLSGDLVKSYCQYQRTTELRVLSVLCHETGSISRKVAIFEKKHCISKSFFSVNHSFLLIIPFNREWVQYLFIAYLSLQISARHPQCSDRFWINSAVDYHAINPPLWH